MMAALMDAMHLKWIQTPTAVQGAARATYTEWGLLYVRVLYH